MNLRGLPLTIAALGTGNLHELSDEILERRGCRDQLNQPLISSHAGMGEIARAG
jgi:hypothetical protein